MSDAMDREAYRRQMRVLKRLKKIGPSDLRELHSSKFEGTPWDCVIPSWMTRHTVIRRLFYLFCMENYHFPPDHPITTHFRKKAEKYLSPANLEAVKYEEEAWRQLQDLERFSKRAIESMPINVVDRFLVGLDQHIQASQKVRRQVLWELFNTPQTGELKRRVRGHPKHRSNGRLNNQKILRDLIRANPGMSFDEFLAMFGPVMPSTSRGSFNQTRSALKKAGYPIQRLSMGPSQPVVQIDENGTLIPSRIDIMD